jgi:ribosomal protein S18 acetylase RimI-like enzyme
MFDQLTVRDWREAPAHVIEPLLAAEMATWRRELHWDVRAAWHVIEPARCAGRLPGLIAPGSNGQSEGWSCFFSDRDSLQVMAFVAANPTATSRLLQSLLASVDAQSVNVITFFVRLAAPALERTLRARGFELAEYRYLVREPAATALPVRNPGRHNLSDLAERLALDGDEDCRKAIADLLARAYRTSTELRAFAPYGTRAEWREYVGNLLGTYDCGLFLAPASFALRRPGEDHLDGLVITTKLDDDTSHVAQLAVDPGERGTGAGGELLRAALTAAADRGLPRTTLLVSASNVRALRLYEAHGFVNRAAFLAARRFQPRRLTSVALATGGASTRR